MTTAQRGHLSRLLRQADAMIADKYEKGAKEHGGLLSDKSALELTDLAIEEAVDQLTYLLTLREKIFENALATAALISKAEVPCT